MAFKDEINYEMISQINKKERKSAKLTSLDSEFYSAIILHLKLIQEEYNKKYLKSPTSTEALLLNNEICKLDAIIKEIYTRRERKILLSSLDTGSAPDQKNMLEHEQRLYKMVVKILNEYRDEVLNQKPNPVCDQTEHISSTPSNEQVETSEQEENTPDTITGVEVPSPMVSHGLPSAEDIVVPNDKPGTTTEKDDIKDEDGLESDTEPTQGVAMEQTLVHVLDDIEPFLGTDLVTYNLHREDIATIPKEMASILTKNNKVRIIEPII